MAVDPDRPPAKLPAVHRQVVLLGVHGAGIGLHARLLLPHRRAERVVGRVPAAQVGVPLEHREGIDPDVGEGARVSQVEPLTHLQAEVAERTGSHQAVGIGHQQEQVARLAAGRLEDRLRMRQRQELADRAVQGAIGLHREVDQALGAVALREVGQLVELAARIVAAARSANGVDRTPPRQRLGEDPEVDAADRLAQVDQLHAEAQVRLVRSISAHRLLVAESRKRALHDRAIR